MTKKDTIIKLLTENKSYDVIALEANTTVAYVKEVERKADIKPANAEVVLEKDMEAKTAIYNLKSCPKGFNCQVKSFTVTSKYRQALSYAKAYLKELGVSKLTVVLGDQTKSFNLQK